MVCVTLDNGNVVLKQTNSSSNKCGETLDRVFRVLDGLSDVTELQSVSKFDTYHIKIGLKCIIRFFKIHVKQFNPTNYVLC